VDLVIELGPWIWYVRTGLLVLAMRDRWPFLVAWTARVLHEADAICVYLVGFEHDL
jgi:hypothetical protein